MAHRAYRKTLRAAVILALVAATLPTTTAAPAAAAPAAAPGALWDELSPGTAVVTTGVGLLHALEDGVGDIILSDSVALLAADWDQFELPIQVAENWTVLVRSGVKLLGWAAGRVGAVAAAQKLQHACHLHACRPLYR